MPDNFLTANPRYDDRSYLLVGLTIGHGWNRPQPGTCRTGQRWISGVGGDPSRLAGAVSIDVASAAAGESAMTPELEQKIWCAYRDAHLALAVAADGYVNTPLAAFIRKRMAEVGPVQLVVPT